MTAEEQSGETQMREVEVLVSGDGAKKVELEEKVGNEEVEKKVEVSNEEAQESSPKPVVVEKNGSFREESNFVSDLKEHEKKALAELKAKLEGKVSVKKKEVEKVEEEENKEEKIDASLKGKSVECDKEADPEAKEADPEAQKIEKTKSEADDVSIWGVPLNPSKGSESTDVVLLKFLRAREFKVNEAFLMLQNTVLWREQFNITSLLEEVFSNDLNSVAYMDGVDREGHPVCYNVYGAFAKEELYQSIFGSEEKRKQFLRWRVQVMEKEIQKLDFKPGGVSSFLQINDLKNLPGPSKKDLRLATKEAVDLLQDNYPEFVSRNIFINVPFWYYAFNALLSPFFTQRTKSKFVFARPSKVTETLLKYIAAEDLPIKYGGLKRENDAEFADEKGGVLETIVKSGTSEYIEIPAPKVGTTLLWDLTVLGGEVTYKEEFVPSNEFSYTLIVQKAKKLGSENEPMRNSFKNIEPGKLVFTVENNSYRKKRVLYRYKVKS